MRLPISPMEWKDGQKSKVAEAADLKLPEFSNILHGRRRPSPDLAEKLEEATEKVLGKGKRIPAHFWVFRKKFTHPLLPKVATTN